MCDLWQISIPNTDSLLPTLGTVGLILIVLEGSMDLELSAEKRVVIRQTLIAASIQLVISIGMMAFVFSYFSSAPLMQTLLNAVPFAVVSSAIAIPSARNLSLDRREFVIYESAFSDILGIFLFNFLLISCEKGSLALGHFGWDIILTILLSTICCLVLAFFLERIRHKVKFLPIISLLLIAYSLAKIWHLSGLLMVLMFGLFINNTDLLSSVASPRFFQNKTLKLELPFFKNLMGEVTFVARTFFFLLFGFSVNAVQLFDSQALMIAGSLISIIFVVRLVYFFAGFKKLPRGLAFLSPRGLITILLFLSIPKELQLPEINNVVLMLVVLFSAFLLTIGLLFSKKNA
jgi:potassium/hydrogen antiporter